MYKNNADWFDAPLGQYLLQREQAYYDQAVADVFGFNAVQVGFARADLLANSRIPLRLHCAEGGAGQVRANPMFLPFAAQSMDLVVLPHVLEFSDHPHKVLREAERVLMPEGRLILSGFNPRSLWGLARRWRGREGGYPWKGEFINLSRLKDWLALLGFEVAAGRMCCYRPPFNRAHWLRRFRFMEPAGDRWWAMGGGVYFVQAIKRVQGMRVITPRWKDALAPALAPAARNVVNLKHYRVPRDKSL